MVNEERPAANIRDGIGQELAGFQVEEALLVTFVAFLINRNAQELTVTRRLEHTECEELHVFGVLVAVKHHRFALQRLAGLNNRGSVAHHLVALMQGRVTVENRVLTAGNHAAVIPPIADAVRNRQICEQGAGLNLLKDALA